MIYYICILDFEATCFENDQVARNKMEIIEFPSILYKIDTNDNSYEFLGEFHKYVKPTYKPILTEFCKKLTGITQGTVNNSDTINIVYNDHIKWLDTFIKDKDNFIICTCGAWDLKTMLPNEIKNKQLKTHKYYNRFINIKDEFNYFYNENARGMIDMLKILKINLTGKHHSGIDDTRNITNILLHMIKNNHHDYKFNYI
jgi:inhibitor of KinA sporulation pathway (predicted exonuclease)